MSEIQRLLWKTKRNLVRISDIRISDIRISDIWISDIRISDIRISDIRAVQFAWSFGYTINVRNPNVQLVESINRPSEIRTVWEWANFGKRRNLNVRIWDTYCMLENLLNIEWEVRYQKRENFLPITQRKAGAG